MVLFFFFFFQAEDGIRDHCVTGVQTCALPICPRRGVVTRSSSRCRRSRSWASTISSSRSEERRVGKECRSRWSRDHSKKKHLLPHIIQTFILISCYSHLLHQLLRHL